MAVKGRFVAFLRAVNVGGTGKLPMSVLKELCENIGLTDVKTYIASGNVVFTSSISKGATKKSLEAALHDYAGKEVPIMLRTPAELKKVIENNPFPDKKPNHTVVLFLDKAPPKDTLDQVKGQVDEEIVLGSKEIYVHYGSGMGSSKLKYPAEKSGTARNINTINKMIELSG